MVRRYIYRIRQHKHPHSPICCYRRRPQGPPSADPLHGILPLYSLIYDTPIYTSTVRCCHNRHEHSAAGSTARPLWRQVSDARDILSINSSAPVTVFELIWINANAVIGTNTSVLVTVFDLISLYLTHCFDLIWLAVFYWILLRFVSIWFNSGLIYSFLVQVTKFKFSQASGNLTLSRFYL